MNSRTTIQEELKELNSILPPVKEPVFTVPDGYFENFSATVLSKIKGTDAASVIDELAELSPVLAGLSKKIPFSVPENYFLSLANEVPVLIGNEKLPSIFAELDKKLPYQVPTGYFDDLATEILAKKNHKPAKVISINRSRWMKVAAAAIVLGIIALSSILYFNNNSAIDPAKQPEAWMAKKLKGISDQALEEFVNAADINTNYQLAQTLAQTAEVRTMLKDISTSELDAFLSAVPADDEELFIIN
jgi:hypothetical protein